MPKAPKRNTRMLSDHPDGAERSEKTPRLAAHPLASRDKQTERLRAMTTAQDVVQAFNILAQAEKTQAATQIQEVVPLPPPTEGVAGTLWIMVVGALVFGFAGGLVAIFVLIEDGKSTDVIVLIVTTVLGLLGASWLQARSSETASRRP
jgi:hypothetical protein